MGKSDLQKELINDIRLLLIDPITQVISYPELKELVSNDGFNMNNAKIKDIFTPEYLIETEEHLIRIKIEYENKINENEYDKPYVVNKCVDTSHSSNSVDIDTLFQTLLVLIGIALIVLFTYNYYITFKLPQYTMQLLGIWMLIISVIYIFSQYIDLMNNGVKNGNECNSEFKQLIEQNLTDFLKFANKENRNWLTFELIKKFLKKYFSYTNNTFNSHIRSKKTLEDFLDQQRHFLLKSENIGLSHKETKQKINEFFNFMINSEKGKSYNLTKQFLEIVEKDKDEAIRKHITSNINISTLRSLLLQIEDTDVVNQLLENDKSTDFLLYNYLIKKLKDSLSSILYFKQNADADSSKISDVLTLNIVLKILKMNSLPEYVYLHDHLIYPVDINNSVKELSNLQTINDRYIRITSESSSLSDFKDHLLKCTSNKSGIRSKFVRDICISNKSIPNEVDQILKTVDDILIKLTDSEGRKMTVHQQLVEFLNLLRSEIVTVNDIRSSKYDSQMKIILFFYQSKFKNTAILDDHISEYLLKIAKSYDDLKDDNSRKTFVHNLKNILRYIRQENKEIKENKRIIDDTDDLTTKKLHVISFDQYIQKIKLFDQEDLVNLHRKYEIMYNEADNVIENSEKTKDLSSVKRLRVFKVSIFLYIITSLLFLSQLIFNNLMKSIFTNKIERLEQNGGKLLDSLVEKGKNMLLDTVKSELVEKRKELKNVSQNNLKNLKTSVKDRLKKNRSELKNIEQIDKEASNIFDVIQSILYILSGWLLSIVLLYSYWLKLDSDQSYNDMVRKNNSLKLESTLKTMSMITKDILELSDDQIKEKYYKRLYDQHVILLDLDDKCNMVNPLNGVGGKKDNKSINFPYNEMTISILLIGFIVSILIFQSIFNNPFEILENLKHIKRSATIENLMRTDNKSESQTIQSGGRRSKSKNIIIPTSSQIYPIQSPILLENNNKTFMKDYMKEVDIPTLQKSLDQLQQLESKVSSRDQTTITKFSLAGSTFLIATMLSYNIMNNALKYKYELFNGVLFSESRCW